MVQMIDLQAVRSVGQESVHACGFSLAIDAHVTPRIERANVFIPACMPTDMERLQFGKIRGIDQARQSLA